MKKTLLLFLSVAVWQVSNAQFTADNLVVVKATSPYTNPTSYKNVGSVSLVELNTSTTNQTGTEIAIPDFLVGQSSSTLTNGLLKLSSDKKYLTVYGYNTASLPTDAAAGNLAPSTNQRTLVLVDENKAISKFDIPKNADEKVIHSATQVRSAIAFNKSTNVYGVYLGGGSNTGTYCGVQYIELNTATNAITLPVPITDLNTSSLGLFNNQLYSTTGVAPKLPDNPPGPNRFNQIGVGLPNTSSNVTDLTSIMTNIELPGDFVFFGTNLLYIADETASTGGIYKFYFDGTNWVAKGKVDSGITGDLLFRGLTGRIEDGKVTLYGVTSLSKKNSIVKIVDATAANATIANGTTGVTLSTLATAGNNISFRGISFTPGSTITLPVSLNNFTAKVINGNVALNWSTASEKENKSFHILRSTDGVNFSKIGEVAGKNNTSSITQYSFIDYSPATGTNYYKLQQIDFNGESQLFGPVSAKTGLNTAANISITAANGSVKVSINTALPETANFTITDIAGRIILSKRIALTKGDNDIVLDSKLKNNAIYVLNINGVNINESFKFKN